jgi:predicted transcriptional regulator
MAKSNTVLQKKRGRGRPATGHDPTTTIRLSDEIKAKIDEWAARQEDKPPRSEAIRRLVEQALAAAPKRGRAK